MGTPLKVILTGVVLTEVSAVGVVVFEVLMGVVLMLLLRGLVPMVGVGLIVLLIEV